MKPEGTGRVPHVRPSVRGPKKMGEAPQSHLLNQSVWAETSMMDEPAGPAVCNKLSNVVRGEAAQRYPAGLGSGAVGLNTGLLVGLNRGWVPHISLVFREMWDTTNLNVRAYRVQKPAGLALWCPTSREKPARCGAPSIVCTDRFPLT
jgi:hypothetical protein